MRYLLHRQSINSKLFCHEVLTANWNNWVNNKHADAVVIFLCGKLDQKSWLATNEMLQ